MILKYAKFFLMNIIIDAYCIFHSFPSISCRAIMDKCGDADDCISTSEAAERASKLSDEKAKNLPVPGEVDFINGGPPCQVCCFSYD